MPEGSGLCSLEISFLLSCNIPEALFRSTHPLEAGISPQLRNTNTLSNEVNFLVQVAFKRLVQGKRRREEECSKESDQESQLGR